MDPETATSTDVLIVGAGPTGLTGATALESRGIRATVIDREEAGSNTSRAAVVHARTLEVLESIGVTERASTARCSRSRTGEVYRQRGSVGLAISRASPGGRHISRRPRPARRRRGTRAQPGRRTGYEYRHSRRDRAGRRPRDCSYRRQRGTAERVWRDPSPNRQGRCFIHRPAHATRYRWTRAPTLAKHPSWITCLRSCFPPSTRVALVRVDLSLGAALLDRY